MSEDATSTTTNYNVRVVISCLGNESRTVKFKDQTEEETQKIIGTINKSFDTIRVNESLLLTGSDGVIVMVNLSNIAFVEVHLD